VTNGPGTSNPQNFAHAIVMVEAVHMGILVPRFPLHVRCTRSENRCRGKQTPLQTASVQALRNARPVEEIAHGDRKHSISPDALYARLGSETTPIIVDVRRDADFAGADTLVADAFHCSPDNVEQWQADLPSGRQVVTHCFHGQQ